MASRYRVKAAAVVVKVDDLRREVYLYRGAAVPAEVGAAEVTRLLKRGLVVETIQDRAEAVEGGPVDPAAPTAYAGPAEDEPTKPDKPQARKPAAK